MAVAAQLPHRLRVPQVGGDGVPRAALGGSRRAGWWCVAPPLDIGGAAALRLLLLLTAVIAALTAAGTGPRRDLGVRV